MMYSIPDRMNEVSALYVKMLSDDKEAPQQNLHGEEDSPLEAKEAVTLSDHEVIGFAEAATNGYKFGKLFCGEWKEDYSSQSEADMALCGFLALHTKDAEQIDRIFRSSALYREKWERTDYRTLTIQKAIKNAPNGWSVARNKALDPDHFFDQGAFVPKRLGDKLIQRLQIISMDGQLWVYKNGAYSPAEDNVIEREAQFLLGIRVTNGRIREALGYIRREVAGASPAPTCSHINVLNGRLNWKEGILEPHHPKHMDVHQLPVEYDPDAICPTFDKFLEDTLGDDELIQLVEEVMGYVLIPTTKFQRAVLFLGDGSNGKTVLLDVIQELLGDNNVSNLSIQSLVENRFAMAGIYGKLANICNDIDSRALQATGPFKQIVSGDSVIGEKKFESSFSFRPYARLLFSTNEIPGSKDRSYGFYRRLIVVPFRNKFEGKNADLDLSHKLIQEKSGILNRALVGLRRLMQNGHFTDAKLANRALSEYRVQNDTANAFIDECVIEDRGASIEKQILRKQYVSWCDQMGYKPVSQQRFRKALLETIPTVEESRSSNRTPWQWVGVKSRYSSSS